MKEGNQRINAVIILEVIGRPKEYLKEALQNLIKQVSAMPGISVKRHDIKEPVKMEAKQKIASSSQEGLEMEEHDFYKSHAEVEIEADNMFNLMVLIFDYPPAHVEIFSPENISLDNVKWNELLNELLRKIHALDEVTRVMQVEKAIIEEKYNNLLAEKNEDKKKKETKRKKKNG